MKTKSKQLTKRDGRKRLTRRELKRDRFVDTVFDWALWSRENVRKVAIGVGALLLIVLAILAWRGTQAGESRRAAVRFQEIWQAYIAGNFQLAANDFRQFQSQYAGSDYADDAAFYLGDSYYQAGDYPAAIAALEEFDRRHAESPYRYAAANVLGAAYESNGDLVRAADAYAEAAERADFDYQRSEALLNQARVHNAAGSAEEAANAYRTVLERYPQTPHVQEARVRLAELTAEPIAGAPPPDLPAPTAESATGEASGSASGSAANPAASGQESPATGTAAPSNAVSGGQGAATGERTQEETGEATESGN